MTYITTKSLMLSAVAASFAITPTYADNAANPFSAKVELFGGWQDGTPAISTNDFSGGVLPSITFNTGHGIGIQLDGLAAKKAGNADAYGGAAHLYWRNSHKGMIGVVGSLYHDNARDVPSYFCCGNNTASNDSQHVALEGELYLNHITLSALGGYEHASHNSTFYGYSRSQDFYTKESVSFYPDANWKLSLGHAYHYSHNAATFSTEYDLTKGHDGTAVSIFAEGRLGEQGYDAAWVGVKFYFGGKKSLMERQRTEDPANDMKDDLFTPTTPFNGGGGYYGGCYAPKVVGFMTQKINCENE